MFASKVAVYNDNKLLGTDRPPRPPTSTPTIRSTAMIAELAEAPRATSRADAAGGRSLRASPETSRACSRCRASTPTTGKRNAARCSTPRPQPLTAQCRGRDAEPRLHARWPATAPPTPPRRAASPYQLARARLCRLRRRDEAEHATRCSRSVTAAADRRWWQRRGRSIRSIRAASPTRTATASAICRAITAQLDHVASLGVDAVWLSPFFTSPMKDFGYDVADYLRRRSDLRHARRFRRAGRPRARARAARCMIDQVYSHTSRPASPGSSESRVEPRQRQGRLVRLGRRQARRLAAQQLAVGVRRPGLDLGRAARPILSAQFPDGAAAAQRAQSGGAGRAARRRALLARPRRRRLPPRRDQLRDARPGADATIRPRPTPASAHPAVRLPASLLQPVPSRHPALPRAHPRADRQLWRALHRGRGRRRHAERGDEGSSPRARRG